jgi:hypothetical protein
VSAELLLPDNQWEDARAGRGTRTRSTSSKSGCSATQPRRSHATGSRSRCSSPTARWAPPSKNLSGREREEHEGASDIAMALQNEEWSRMDEIVAYSPCLEEVPTADGIVCERNLHHFLCGTCVRKEMQKILENVQEEIPRSQHRAQGGRISRAAALECDAPYPERALARILSDALFTEYRAAQNAVVEQRLYEQGQQRVQEQLEVLRRHFHNTNNVARAEQDEAATAELIRRQWPNAVQCPRCHAGPVTPENCFDLQAHDGKRARGGGAHQ